MSIDRKWELILTTLQRKDAALKKEDISFIQDEFEDASGDKKRGQSRLICESLGVHERQSNRSSYFQIRIELSFETYRQIYQKGKNATKIDIVLKKAEVLRPKKGRHRE